MPTITPFLWFEKNNAQEAMEFYCSVFKNSHVLMNTPALVSFELNGQKFYGLNAGPYQTFNDAISFYIECIDQDEVDYYWNTLSANGGQSGQCGWLKDRFGVSWQVVPKQLGELMGMPDKDAVQRVNQAMLSMKKLIISELEAAYKNK